jgi:hypothetical protein
MPSEITLKWMLRVGNAVRARQRISHMSVLTPSTGGQRLGHDALARSPCSSLPL